MEFIDFIITIVWRIILCGIVSFGLMLAIGIVTEIFAKEWLSKLLEGDAGPRLIKIIWCYSTIMVLILSFFVYPI